MGMDPPETAKKSKKSRGHHCLEKLLIFVIAMIVLPFSCCKLTKFPPQIFGTTEDHFRAFVIDPIPDSVEILDVEVDDLIIHPDYEYNFRFTVNKDDLEEIISHNVLQPTSECNAPSPAPEWWNINSLGDVEAYQYKQLNDLIITLCYHVPSQTAYYSYFVY